MTQENWNAVDAYISQKLLSADPDFDWVLKASDEGGLDPISVAPNQGKFLNLLARLQGARRILEVGTLGGYSAIWLARALPEGGLLVTLEINPKAAQVAQANFTKAGLAGAIELRLGPAAESLKKLSAEKTAPFDMVFIDADKPGYPEYLSGALKLSRVGTLIILDNMVRKGELVTAGADDPRVTGTRGAYELLAKEPRVSATAVQTVGVKGHDGFVMALVVS